jgi:hypothetical protein
MVRIAILLIPLCSFLYATASAEQHTLNMMNNASYKMYVETRIIDIDPRIPNVNIEIFVRLGPVPQAFNETAIWVNFIGGGYVMFPCNYSSSDSFGKYFQGNCSTSWPLFGIGELFPFDSYYMSLNISVFTDMSFRIHDAKVIFLGAKQGFLMDNWQTVNSSNIIQTSIYGEAGNKLVAELRRKPFVPFLEFVLPILLCYFLLGFSLFMDPKSRMQEMLTIYLSLFVFVPTFFFGIQNFMPCRSLLSLPEFLLVNLITTVAILGISIILSEFVETIRTRHANFPPAEWFGLIFTIIVFIIYYSLLFSQIMFWSGSIEALWIFLLVVLSSVVAVLGFVSRLKMRKRGKSKSENCLLMCYE